MGDATTEHDADRLHAQVLEALGAGDVQRALDLTEDLQQVAVASPVSVRLDLARVAALVRAQRGGEAVGAMRALLDVHLLIDVKRAIEQERLLLPAERAWDVIRAGKRRKAMRPVWLWLAVGVFMTFASGVLVLFVTGSYQLSCERVAQTGTADCVIVRSWFGTERDRRKVQGVRAAKAYRGAGTSGYRIALQTGSQEVHVHPNALGGDRDRAKAFNAFLADRTRRTLTMRWDFDLLLIGGLAALMAGLGILTWALVKAVRLRLSPPD